MIYSNINKYVIEREMSFGSLKGIQIGERGKNKYEHFVPTIIGNRNLIEKDKVHPHLSLTTTKSGNPRLYVNREPNMHILLSSHRNTKELNHGYIFVLYPDWLHCKLLCAGWSSEHFSTEAVYWDEALVHIIDNKIPITFKVQYSGSHEEEIFVVYNCNVHRTKVNSKEVEEIYSKLNMDIPYTQTDDELINIKEWYRIY
jgi:hypothetical protein